MNHEKNKYPFLVFVKVDIIDKGSLRRRLMMIKTKNQMTLIAKMHSLESTLKNLNMNLNIHVLIHHM